MQPNQMFSLEGLTALVCGASQGIGKATAHAMARQGAKVVLLARNVEALEQVRNQLDQPERHLCITADLSSANEIDSAIEKMITKGFSPEILVNNAGGPSSGPLLDAHPETFEAAFRAHVLAQLQLSQKLVLWPNHKHHLNISPSSDCEFGSKQYHSCGGCRICKNIVQRARPEWDHSEQCAARLHSNGTPREPHSGGCQQAKPQSTVGQGHLGKTGSDGALRQS
jgi:NAD(P)-dependent dehydrogenase (short-subunit alcohol dehydrogenase family)